MVGLTTLSFDILISISTRLNLRDIVKLAQSSKYFNLKFLHNEKFWRCRFQQDYIKKFTHRSKPTNKTWQQWYREAGESLFILLGQTQVKITDNVKLVEVGYGQFVILKHDGKLRSLRQSSP